jgi:N6-L-threonylcarbamoyladenine synthase
LTADLCLGLDTSNYTTSAAIFDGHRDCGQNSGKPLTVPEGTKGLRQNEALFQHVKSLPQVLSNLELEHTDIRAVGVASKPREEEGSYMPCFLAGVCAGKILAQTLRIGYYEFSHQQGHIASAAWSSGSSHLLDRPHLAWHLSGGTTELLYVTPMGKSVSCRRIGGSNDISAGQLIDRTGFHMGMDFPAGKRLDELACKGRVRDSYKIKLRGTEFSLSGMENKVIEMISKGCEHGEIAVFVFETLADVLIRACENAGAEYGPLPILFSGGVSSSIYIRSRIPKGIFPAPEYATDNALGIALLTYRALEE